MQHQDNQPYVSHSMRESLKSCPRKVYFRWVAGIRRRSEDSPARAIGRAFHTGIDMWRNQCPPSTAIFGATESLIESLSKTRATSKEVFTEVSKLEAYLQGYFRRFPEDLNFDWSSSEMKIQVRGEIGFIDGVVIDKDGMTWVIEDKTTSRPSGHTEQALRLNDQLLSYLCLLQDMGYSRIGGCIFRQTVKSLLRPKIKETNEQFVERVTEVYESPDKYLEFKVRFEPEEISLYRAEKNFVNEMCTQLLATATRKEDCTRNSSQCIGMYGPCDYLSLCSKPEHEYNGNLFETTSQNSLDGGRLRRTLKLKDEENDEPSTCSGLRVNDPNPTGELPGSPFQPTTHAVVWDAGNGKD